MGRCFRLGQGFHTKNYEKERIIKNVDKANASSSAINKKSIDSIRSINFRGVQTSS